MKFNKLYKIKRKLKLRKGMCETNVKKDFENFVFVP